MVTAMNTEMLTGVYRTEFSIMGPEVAEASLYGRACGLVRDLLEGLPASVELVDESGEFEGLAYQRFQTEVPHSRNPELQLRLDVKLSTKGGPVSVAVQSAFMDADEPAPPELVAGPPRLVLDLFRAFECFYGADILSPGAVRVTPDSAEEFANRIFDHDRQTPILVMSENWRRQTPVNPNWLQQILAGLAEVVTYGTDTADELRRHVGFQLACFNGAMRIYQPGCSRDDGRERHRFWMPADASVFLRRPAGRVVRELVRYLPESADTREFENVRAQVQQGRMVELAAERLARPLRQRVSELEQQVDSLNQDLRERDVDASIEALELSKQHEEYNQIRDLEVENSRLRQELQDEQDKRLNHEIALEELEVTVKAKDSQIRGLIYRLETMQPEEFVFHEEPLLIESVEDAVMHAAFHFDLIQFLNSAYESADGYPYQHPDRVYRAFSALQRIAVHRREGPLKTSVAIRLQEEMQDREFEYAAHESRPTMNKFGHTRRFDGYQMQEHIKIGSGTSNKQHYIRIHFCWENESGQYIIGHVGEHLPTVSG